MDTNRIDPPASFEKRGAIIRDQLSKSLDKAEGTANVGLGPTKSQAIVAHGADLVQAVGMAGAGVKVCVISNGIDSLSVRQAGGELPAVDVVSGQAGNGDEGTAMLELVADIAPSATLGYATGNSGAAQMATNIATLGGRGCDIIVDDVTYYSEGAFQEDIIANAVTAFVNAGGMFFSSAGNSGRFRALGPPYGGSSSGTWEGDFANGGAPPTLFGTSGTLHSFGSVSFNNLRSAGDRITLKWSDPIGASSSDHDLFITNGAETALVASSTATQSGTQDPLRDYRLYRHGRGGQMSRQRANLHQPV